MDTERSGKWVMWGSYETFYMWIPNKKIYWFLYETLFFTVKLQQCNAICYHFKTFMKSLYFIVIFAFQGIAKHFGTTYGRGKKFVTLVKAMPDDYNKSTFDPKNLAAADGTYHSLYVGGFLGKVYRC